MNLYLIRHGESEANAEETYRDQNTKLSVRGLRQAGKLAKRFSKIPVDVIFSSDYPRALQTAAYIKKIVRKKIIVTPLVREEGHPSEFNGKHHTHPDVMRGKAFFKKHYRRLRYSDEETFSDVKMRVQKFIRMLEKRKEKNVVVVSHGITKRMIIALMMFGRELTPRIFQKFRIGLLTKNTGITVCEYKKGEWRVLTWNDHAHLG